MNKKRPVYGVSNFRMFIEKGGYFVDKTKFIEVLENEENLKNKKNPMKYEYRCMPFCSFLPPFNFSYPIIKY